MELDRLIKEQEKLSKEVSLKNGFRKITRVAGFDIAYSGNKIFCAGVVLDYDSLELIEKKIVRTSANFPYVPTFLSYREFPAMLKAYLRLNNKPDIIFIDGQGICHPRGLGLASHIGVSLNKPSIGAAKSMLCGDFKTLRHGKPEKMFFANKQVGWAFMDKFKPIFISPGHRVSIRDSLDISLKCIKKHRTPEPLRLAHLYAEEAKRKHGNRKAK